MVNHILGGLRCIWKCWSLATDRKGTLNYIPTYPVEEFKVEQIQAVVFQHLTYTARVIIPYFTLLKISGGEELIWQWCWYKFQPERTVGSITHSKRVHVCHMVYALRPSLHICTVWPGVNTQRQKLYLLLQKREVLGSKHSALGERWHYWPWNYHK